jgi:Rod binding domain-containing protein
MSTAAIGPKPAFTPLTLPASTLTTLAGDVPSKATPAMAAKARATAQNFEQVFLNSMFSQMFTGIDGDGPFGGTPAIGVWRSFLTQEYARSLAKNGGIGIADHVYTSLMAQQEVGAR